MANSHPATNAPLREHFDGAWRKMGRSVYCSCGVRLYQGSVPPTTKDRQVLVEALDSVWELLRVNINELQKRQE